MQRAVTTRILAGWFDEDQTIVGELLAQKKTPHAVHAGRVATSSSWTCLEAQTTS
jgi:hypothetical protein